MNNPMVIIDIPQYGMGLYKMTAPQILTVLKAYHQFGCSSRKLHVDGATVYENQTFFADAVKELGIGRERFFLVDKLWDTEHGDVEGACRRALARLNVQQLDLYLIHWPFSMVPSDADPLSAKRDSQGNPVPLEKTLNEVWADMEKLVFNGLVRHIGVSNFYQKQIASILQSARVRPEVVQIESHPWLPQQSLIDYCHSEGIVVEAYSPLGTSLLLSNPVVTGIAREVGGTPAQVLLAFARQRGLVALCKTGHPERLLENLKNVDISEEQMARLLKLENGNRLFHPKNWYGDRYISWPE
jgi:diketogulonate reductase-like aldo/keto reductase